MEQSELTNYRAFLLGASEQSFKGCEKIKKKMTREKVYTANLAEEDKKFSLRCISRKIIASSGLEVF